MNLVGLLAYGRFESTAVATKHVAPTIADTTTSSTSAQPMVGEGEAGGRFEADAKKSVAEAQRLYDAWMAIAEPAAVAAFRAVEIVSTGGSLGSVRLCRAFAVFSVF